ncbi:MAG TPA: hypothetical protein VMA34_17940 [Terracidiphilus sp.]|nr:hypothetical protein [Terracidiphilus sp.]
MAPAAPPVPGLQYQLDSYASKVRALGVLWFIYAGLSILLGLVGLAFAKAIMSGPWGPWMHGPAPPTWIFPVIFHFAWIFLALRSGLAIAAGWGLLERTQWGRIVAVIAAVFSLLKFPFGTALGIWTLVVLLGYRNSTMYDQIQTGV